MSFNEDESRLAWLKLLLLSIKTPDEDNKSTKKQEKINEIDKDNSTQNKKFLRWIYKNYISFFRWMVMNIVYKSIKKYTKSKKNKKSAKV